MKYLIQILILSLVSRVLWGAEPPTMDNMSTWGRSNLEAEVRPWGAPLFWSDIEAKQKNLRPWGAPLSYIEEETARPEEEEVIDIPNDGLGLIGKELRDTALEVAAQAAMAHRLRQYELRFNKQASMLDRVFRFDPLMLNNGSILPPVISTSLDNMVVGENAQVIRISSQNFSIVKQSRFVSVAPTWRNYLLNIPYTLPVRPDKTLLPKNEAEYRLWEHWLKRGWIAGEKQAEDVIRINIAKLRRDLVGMTLYHVLLLRGMVSQPIITKTSYAVNGDDSNLIIDDRELRISVKPKMELNSNHWRAIEQLPELFGKGLD